MSGICLHSYELSSSILHFTQQINILKTLNDFPKVARLIYFTFIKKLEHASLTWVLYLSAEIVINTQILSVTTEKLL